MNVRGWRACAAVAVVAAVAAVAPANATTSGPKPQITDPVGDANGVNDQGSGTAYQSVSTPADDAPADITSMLIQSVFKKVKVHGRTRQVWNGFSVTLSLAAAPDSVDYYAVQATVPGACPDGIDFQYSAFTAQPLNDVSCTTGGTGIAINRDLHGHAVVKGHSIVWTVPANALAPRSSLFRFIVLTSPLDGPNIDEAYGPNVIYTVGQ